MGVIAVFVLAAPIDNSKIRSPSTGLNFSSNSLGNATVSAFQFFNVTFWNASDGNVNSIINATAVTFWYNTSANVWAIVGNASICSPYSGGTLGAIANVSCFGYLNASSWHNGTIVKEGYYTVNATVFNTSGGADNLLNSVKMGNLTTILIDNSDPSSATFQTLTSGNNFSTKVLGGNLNITISAVDNLANISSVVFFIVNATGSIAGNVTLYAAQAQSTPIWHATLNTSHVPDGTYNITALVNDTAGNFNLTANGTTYAANAILTNLIMDNTAPGATATCSPSTVDLEDAFPCTCSGSDNLAGVNTTSGSSTSPDGTGTPINTGTFTYTCTVSDKAGNTKSSTATYTVQSSGGSGLSSPSSSSASSSSTGTSSGSSGSTGSAGSSGSTGPTSSNGSGNVGAGAGAGGSGQGIGADKTGASGSGFGMGWIIALVVAVVIVVVIVVMMKRKQ